MHKHPLNAFIRNSCSNISGLLFNASNSHNQSILLSERDDIIIGYGEHIYRLACGERIEYQ